MDHSRSIPETSKIAGAKLRAQKHDALRILDIRHGEEAFITENSGLIDARILHWLLHNESRLSDSSSVGHMLMKFPDLVRHQELLIGDRSYALLEHFLSSWYSKPYGQLDPDRQRDVLEIVRTLASIESEEDVEDSPALPGVVMNRHSRGFRLYPPSRGASSNRRSTLHKPQRKPRLSATSVALVRRLLEELPSLPIPLIAFTIRLGILMVGTPTEGHDWVMVSRGTAILLRRIMSRQTTTKPDESSTTDLLHAVNTVIFVALHDVSFPEWKLTLPSGRIDWFITLPDLLVRSPVDVIARRQLAWAISTLPGPWANGQSEVNEQSENRLPVLRIPINPTVPSVLTSLANMMLQVTDGNRSASDLSYDALNAALVALDRTLREWLDDGSEAYSENHLAVCHELRTMYGPLLLKLYARLTKGDFREEQVLRMLVPMTRLAVTLFLVQPDRDEGTYSILLTTTLCIFQSLITSHRLPITPNHTTLPDGATIRQWIYRAACSIMVFYLAPPAKLVPGESQRLPDLNFHDVDSTMAVVLDLVSVLELISKQDIHPYQPHTQLVFLLQLFLGIMKDIFTRNILLEDGLHDGGDWDWDATWVVADFIQQGGLNVLIASSYPPIHIELLAPAVNTLHTVFFAHACPRYRQLFGPASPNDRHHPAHDLASALIGPYTQFLRTFEDILRKGNFQDVAKEDILAKVVAIGGYLALYENPSHWPKLDVVLTMQSFFSTLLFAHGGKSLYELRMRMRNPTAGQALRAKILVPETVAVGLIRILAVVCGSGAFAVADLHKHCVECQPTRAQMSSVRGRLSGANGWVGWESKATLWAMTRAVLWTIHAIWGGQDRRFMRLRRSLFDHGLAQQVRCLQRWGGEIGLLANSLAYRLGGTCRYEDTQALLLLEYKLAVEQEGGIFTIS